MMCALWRSSIRLVLTFWCIDYLLLDCGWPQVTESMENETVDKVHDPLYIYGSEDTHREYTIEQRFFCAFHMLDVAYNYLLQTFWDSCEEQIFRNVICKPWNTIQLQGLVQAQVLWVCDGVMKLLKKCVGIDYPCLSPSVTFMSCCVLEQIIQTLTQCPHF